MTVIRVPKPPADAYNQDRPISDLLKAQLQHLQEAERKFVSNIKTEAEAANFIRHVTRLLHPEGAVSESRAAKPSVATMATGKGPVAVARKSKSPGIVVDRIAAQAVEQDASARQVPAAGKQRDYGKAKTGKKRR